MWQLLHNAVYCFELVVIHTISHLHFCGHGKEDIVIPLVKFVHVQVLLHDAMILCDGILTYVVSNSLVHLRYIQVQVTTVNIRRYKAIQVVDVAKTFYDVPLSLTHL